VNVVARSLIVQEKYLSLEDAIKALALSAVQDKVAYYQRRIRRLERKYAVDFDAFTARLREGATPVEEDDWLAWRSARSMLADWQKAYRELRNDGQS
jgi:hypothetical protein